MLKFDYRCHKIKKLVEEERKDKCLKSASRNFVLQIQKGLMEECPNQIDVMTKTINKTKEEHKQSISDFICVILASH